jgi:hypothetical protein
VITKGTKMTALPPDANQHAATQAVAHATEAAAGAATAAQTAPRPAGSKLSAAVEVPAKTMRSTSAKC